MYKRQIKDLPCAVNVDDYFDDTTVSNKHLPCDVIDVLDVYDDEIITYLGMTNNTKGDLNIINADKVYEIIIRNNPIDYYGRVFVLLQLVPKQGLFYKINFI